LTSSRNAARQDVPERERQHDQRARALRDVAENPILNQQEVNRVFVLAQYFDYLRRNPNTAP